MNPKYALLIPISGMILSGWGGGILSVGYLIGATNPINSINALGLTLAVIGMAMIIISLSKLKRLLEIQVE